MADRTEQPAVTKAEFKTIEFLQEKHQVKDHIFEGVKAANNWKAGKQVTETEFLKECNAFLKAPVLERRK